MAQWTRRKGIMLCYPFEEKRLASWGDLYLVQPKLDGVRCRAIIDNEGDVILLSSEENPIDSVPHITGELMRSGLRNVELDGELYRHGMPFEEIVSRTSRTTNIHSGFEDIQYHVFDYVSDASQLRRSADLINMLSDLEGDIIRLVKPRPASTLDNVMQLYDNFISEGYEGFVIRHPMAAYERRRVTTMMKFKPKKSDIYEIIGVTQEVDQYGIPKGTLGALVCRGNDGTAFNVGTGFTAINRAVLWKVKETLPGKCVEISYQHLTAGRGVPRFPVYTGILQKTDKEDKV
jgi:ATP-dependent DNA ligase